MILKEGVRLGGISPELSTALVVADGVYRREGAGEMVVTAITDGRHKPGSLHYKGHAADLRTKHLTPERARLLWAALSSALGDEFDVVLEYNPPHLHLEFDPK